MTDEPLTAQQALEQALWYTRYAYDRIGNDGRLYHPGVRSHSGAGKVQLEAAVELAHPDCDQIRVDK